MKTEGGPRGKRQRKKKERKKEKERKKKERKKERRGFLCSRSKAIFRYIGSTHTRSLACSSTYVAAALSEEKRKKKGSGKSVSIAHH